MQLISFVIPVFNSENSLKELCMRIKKECKVQNVTPEIILIDDCSRDRSRDIMKELQQQDDKIKILVNDINLGQQRTVLKGIQFANGESVITMDDDLEHPPEALKKLLELIEQGNDIGYGVLKYDASNKSVIRVLGSNLRNILFKIIFKIEGDFKLSSYRIFSRRIIDKLRITKDQPFVYVSAIFLNLGAKVSWTYVNAGMRKYGVSNYKLIDLIKLYFDIIRYYSKDPISEYYRKVARLDG